MCPGSFALACLTMGRAALILAATCVVLSCVHAQIMTGASLHLEPCGGPAATLQTLVYSSASRTVTTQDGALCVTYTDASPAALVLERCSGVSTQSWEFDSGSGAFLSAPLGSSGCVAWNAQDGSNIISAGATVSTWTCTELGFNSVFAPAYPEGDSIGYNFSSVSSRAFSGLCVTASNPSTPVIGSPQQIEWQLTEMACFIHYNMATMAGTQGCSGCGGAPPDISLWNPSALDTDAWIQAGIAMGCKRFVYVAKVRRRC